jgi:type I restriction-modification system DNA methylase subunit
MENAIADIVNLIHDKNRADALDKINDLMNSKAAEALDTYKKVVADTYFNEPVETLKDQ